MRRGSSSQCITRYRLGRQIRDCPPVSRHGASRYNWPKPSSQCPAQFDRCLHRALRWHSQPLLRVKPTSHISSRLNFFLRLLSSFTAQHPLLHNEKQIQHLYHSWTRPKEICFTIVCVCFIVYCVRSGKAIQNPGQIYPG